MPPLSLEERLSRSEVVKLVLSTDGGGGVFLGDVYFVPELLSFLTEFEKGPLVKNNLGTPLVWPLLTHLSKFSSSSCPEWPFMTSSPTCESDRMEDCPVSGVTMHHVTSGKTTKGWIHTHGMKELGLPELEIRNVPSFLADGAARLLRHVCRYMNEPGVVVKPGETMETSPHTRFRFVKSQPIPGQDNHFEDERWQIVEIEMMCEECANFSETKAKEFAR